MKKLAGLVSLCLGAASVYAAIELDSRIGGAERRRSQIHYAEGYVFNDANKNGLRDRDERGLAGIRVSDQHQITLTDRSGKWRIPVEEDGDTRYFVIKPRGWMTPVDDQQLPKFYYIHKPEGSPKTKYAGVDPTGPLPSSIDFALYEQKEPGEFKALFFGDTQPRDLREVEYIQHDVVEPIVGNTDARFGLTLGDVAFDDLDVFGPLAKTIALIGIPWYNVLGNHDINYDSLDDEHSDETFERWFGPNYFSWDWGTVHFVALDNVHWQVDTATKRGSYKGVFGKEQLDWLKKDLDLLRKDQLVVLTMHIPLPSCEDRQELFRLIEKKPYVLSVAAHTHFQEHVFLKEKDGWHGAHPHHHVVNVTACGSWWQGSPDEYGIPHTTMRCGAPNGYAEFRFDGSQYSIEFRAARRNWGFQMAIYAPEKLLLGESAGSEVLVNVFGGSERSKVEMRVGNGEWTEMKRVRKPDPEYVAMVERDKNNQRPFRALPAPIDSPHLWQGFLPRGLDKGMIPVHVRTTDMFGQASFATRGVLIQ